MYYKLIRRFTQSPRRRNARTPETPEALCLVRQGGLAQEEGREWEGGRCLSLVSSGSTGRQSDRQRRSIMDGSPSDAVSVRLTSTRGTCIVETHARSVSEIPADLGAVRGNRFCSSPDASAQLTEPTSRSAERNVDVIEGARKMGDPEFVRPNEVEVVDGKVNFRPRPK